MIFLWFINRAWAACALSNTFWNTTSSQWYKTQINNTLEVDKLISFILLYLLYGNFVDTFSEHQQISHTFFYKEADVLSDTKYHDTVVRTKTLAVIEF